MDLRSFFQVELQYITLAWDVILQEEHDGSVKGRDRICRNTTNHIVSSYVNIDKEPIFYKTTRMTWVANELVCDDHHFFLECMRVPPDWHLWVYMVGGERDADRYQTTITLFREDEYGRVGEAGFSAQRSYTGQVRTRPHSGIRCNISCIGLNEA
jgi:hypothetical protein